MKRTLSNFVKPLEKVEHLTLEAIKILVNGLQEKVQEIEEKVQAILEEEGETDVSSDEQEEKTWDSD